MEEVCWGEPNVSENQDYFRPREISIDYHSRCILSIWFLSHSISACKAVEELYEASRARVLKLYLFTKQKQNMDNAHVVGEEEPGISVKVEEEAPEVEAVPAVLPQYNQHLIIDM